LTDDIPSRLLYAFYGDDFTGSTDVLEGLALHGVPSVLFTQIPGEDDLIAFAHCRAVGIAGESRSRSPAWMTRNLPAVFAAMRRLGAPINHYKVCSTFDSSPRIGSIGRAMELGRNVFKGSAVPVVVGAPHLGRAVAFSNLFAVERGVMHRIDRHPTMRQHPVTPMGESDLRLHLARQTTMRIGSVDLRSFQPGLAEKQFVAEEVAHAKAIVFDGMNDAMLDETARIVWRRALMRPVFAVGSSGLTYGLMRHWRELGILVGDPVPPSLEPADRLLVLSGSCSPVTAAQIRRARRQGFAAWRIRSAEDWRLHEPEALRELANGRSVLLYSALGPQAADKQFGERFSTFLGKGLRRLLLASGVRRVVIVGGDTSTHVVKQLEINALTFAASLVPGVPLCCIYAPDSPLNGIEIALKGGQIGPEDFFARVRDGR
jgi:uncharacterized protein YgbK (DUF1537 family)